MKIALLNIMIISFASAENLNTISNNDKLHFFDFDNAKMIWNNNWSAYRDARDPDGDGNNCRLAESDNFLGAQ